MVVVSINNKENTGEKYCSISYTHTHTYTGTNNTHSVGSIAHTQTRPPTSQTQTPDTSLATTGAKQPKLALAASLRGGGASIGAMPFIDDALLWCPDNDGRMVDISACLQVSVSVLGCQSIV